MFGLGKSQMVRDRRLRESRRGNNQDAEEKGQAAHAYLNKSSNALRALVGAVGAAECVSRSTVTRGEKNVQLFRASFGLILEGIACAHSKRAPVSNDTHWAQACRSAPHLWHLESVAI